MQGIDPGDIVRLKRNRGTRDPGDDWRDSSGDAPGDTDLRRLSMEALRGVTTLLPRLAWLDLTQCPHIDDGQARELARSKPELTVISYYGEKFGGGCE